MRLPKGFRIELVASEPVVEEPSCVAFDEHGRMFVCELHGYNIEGHIDTRELNKKGVLDTDVRRLRWELQGGEIAEEAARNQYGVLKMLVDTDGDHLMDKAIVWADDLPPCYGILPVRGGILVTCAPDILFFADRNGDGVPEVRETLFTGFGIHVLERGINNPRWGLDNWIYVGSGGDGGTITGPNLDHPFELGSTDFRIRSDGSAIEHVNGSVGTFGMTLNDVGDRFPSSGGRPAIYALPLPYRYLTRNPYVATPATNHTAAHYNRGFRISAPHPWRVKRGIDPEWVKFYGTQETNSNYFSGGCGTTFYGDVLFPAAFRGNLFYCEPSLNIVHRALLRREDSGYRAERALGEEESEFLASTDQWFRPMNLRVGPEGALYIVDMYREIIEDYSAIPRFLQQQYGLDKGKDHGRLWRLVPENHVAQAVPEMSQMGAEELVDEIRSGHVWRRKTAQRLLVEGKFADARDALVKVLRAESNSHESKIHALYTLEGLGKLESVDVGVALRCQHYGARLHGLRLMRASWLEENPSLAVELSRMSDNPSASVRLQLAMTLGEVDATWATDVLVSLARRYGEQRWMAEAILSSSNSRHGGDLLLGLLDQRPISVGALALVAPLAATLVGREEGEGISAVLRKVVAMDEDVQIACLGGLVSGGARGESSKLELSDAWEPLSEFLKSSVPELQQLAAKLAVRYPILDGVPLRSVFADAERQALDDALESGLREQAFRLLANAPFDTLAPVAVKMFEANQPPGLRDEAIAALGASADERAGAALLQMWPSLTPPARAKVLEAVFDSGDRLSALLDAIESGMVHRGDISVIQRDQMIKSARRNVAQRAERLFAEESASDAELQVRLDLYQKALAGSADVNRGRQVYAQHCVICHKLNEEGNEVGPALGSSVNQPDESILLNIFDPGGKIDPEYKLYLVVTKDDKSFAGVLASESPTSVTLKRADGANDVILRNSIRSMVASEVSLMPANLHELINPQDAAHLIAFMRHAFGAGQVAQPSKD